MNLGMKSLKKSEVNVLSSDILTLRGEWIEQKAAKETNQERNETLEL
jgi:hypothetical protein